LNTFVLELAFRLTELLAKRPSIDEIFAKLQVLESEHESLQKFLKESHENETKLKKDLQDKHAQEMSEMAEKLKNSNSRVKTLPSKLKAAEAEATDVDKMIFRKDFTSPACICYSSLSSSETYHTIFCVYQRFLDLNGKKITVSPVSKHMKKPETISRICLRHAGILLEGFP
jgi:Fe2+ transport system protein B